MKTTTPLTSALLSILLAWCVACVQPVVANQDITVNITTLANYTQPNEALAQHDLDANSSQHKPYLDAQIQAR